MPAAAKLLTKIRRPILWSVLLVTDTPHYCTTHSLARHFEARRLEARVQGFPRLGWSAGTHDKRATSASQVECAGGAPRTSKMSIEGW